MRRLFLLIALLFPLPASALTQHYGNLAAWQAAVEPYQVEDFESFPEVRLPIDGGTTDFGLFLVENDDQGNNEWSGLSGLWRGSNWYAYPEIPDTMNLIISIEGGYPDEGGGPSFIDAVFTHPVSAYALEYSWCEDDPDCTFNGVVFDQPTTRVSLWELAGCEHSWCAIDAIDCGYLPPSPSPPPPSSSPRVSCSCA
jgi:hypothetical protein